MAYTYTIADEIVNGVNVITQGNTVSDAAFTGYVKTRTVMFSFITQVLLPFLLFITFTSSFIDRNQDLTKYLFSSMLSVLTTGLILYIAPDIITNLLNVSILNPAYIATSYFQNIVYIMIANMLLGMGSFIFVVKGRGYSA